MAEYLPVFCHVGFFRSCELGSNYCQKGSINESHLLGEEAAADLLQETLDEEGAADEALTTLAETVINVEALAPAASA